MEHPVKPHNCAHSPFYLLAYLLVYLLLLAPRSSEQYIRDIKDVELSVGDKVDVTVTEINDKGRYRVAINSEFGIKSKR